MNEMEAERVERLMVEGIVAVYPALARYCRGRGDNNCGKCLLFENPSYWGTCVMTIFDRILNERRANADDTRNPSNPLR